LEANWPTILLVECILFSARSCIEASNVHSWTSTSQFFAALKRLEDFFYWQRTSIIESELEVSPNRTSFLPSMEGPRHSLDRTIVPFESSTDPSLRSFETYSLGTPNSIAFWP
jgi:hypothetical protein